MMRTGDGLEVTPFKTEWVTLKDNTMLIGGTGANACFGCEVCCFGMHVIACSVCQGKSGLWMTAVS